MCFVYFLKYIKPQIYRFYYLSHFQKSGQFIFFFPLEVQEVLSEVKWLSPRYKSWWRGKRFKTGFSGSQFDVISCQIKPALHSALSVFQSGFLGGYHWYKGENVSFGCMLCTAIRSITLFLKEHESHTDSQQPLSHLVKFTVEVTMSTPIFFSSFHSSYSVGKQICSVWIYITTNWQSPGNQSKLLIKSLCQLNSKSKHHKLYYDGYSRKKENTEYLIS